MTKRRTDRQLADDIVAKLNSEEDKAAHPAMEINSLLQQARDAGGGALRMQYLETAQRQIAKLDPSRHGRLIAQLQGELLALQGRRGDTKVAHVTPGEVVIPARLQTPELLAALRAAAKQAGIDPARLVVGSDHNSVNPGTGQAEFYDDLQGIEEITVYGDIITDDPSTNKVITGLHPSIRNDAARFINDVKDSTGQQLRIPYGTGTRTIAEQDAVYAQGRTAPGTTAKDIVTQAPGGKSYHNYGLAFDVVGLNPDGKTPNWEIPFERYAPLAKERGFEWGGNWKDDPDRPHFQRTYGYTTEELRKMIDSGNTYPTIPGKRNR